jgi:hypothetical protein
LSEETVQEITLPDDATPASIVGETDLMPGQELLNRTAVLAYARQMQRGEFPWQAMQEEQPMAVEVGTNGKVITQGHHRYVAARLAGIQLPVPIEHRYELLEQGLEVPFAKSWDHVTWE